MRDCNRVDGFSIAGTGNADFYDCIAFNNGDDGLSHHDSTTGSIHGGEYAYNGKGGLAPATGSRVDVYNAITHDNDYGFYCENGGADNLGRHVNHVGNVAYDNTTGISVLNYHIKSFNCDYTDNTTPTDVTVNADTSLTVL